MSGATIGGVVGAFVGFWFGGPAGAQAGWMIGSAIGGYVDPVQVKGPRLTDATQTVASVGHPIPFGYGTFAVGGTVIWWDELKEHKKTKSGKGSGTEQVVYTYTRSYAVAFCEPIAGYLAIKRNGKVVYTSDPDAPAEDLEYAQKWLEKATLYLGGEDQMPDSTIVAVEGVGNVSPFRDLCYVVIENDDLTELAGAIPQYEAVVNATSDLYLTTPPYMVEIEEALQVAANAGGGSLDDLVESFPTVESMSVGFAAVGGDLRVLRRDAVPRPEELAVAFAAAGGTLKVARRDAVPKPEELSVAFAAVGGQLKVARLDAAPPREELSVQFQVVGGNLGVP